MQTHRQLDAWVLNPKECFDVLTSDTDDLHPQKITLHKLCITQALTRKKKDCSQNCSKEKMYSPTIFVPLPENRASVLSKYLHLEAKERPFRAATHAGSDSSNAPSFNIQLQVHPSEPLC
jgi:hypothetical protein